MKTNSNNNKIYILNNFDVIAVGFRGIRNEFNGEIFK